MALSDPLVSTLLQDRFVPVRFSLWMAGPRTDIAGRDFVLRDGHYPYPGLIVTDPELNVLARTKPTADVQQTLEALRDALRMRPDLGPATLEPLEPLYDSEDPGQSAFLALQSAFEAGPAQERPTLIPAFEAWLDAHAEHLPDAAAMARALLGDCYYIRGDFHEAEARWREVVERHPNHPVRHRCSFNLLDKNAWPEETHPAIRDFPRPGLATHPPVVPYPTVRARNLAAIASDPRYIMAPCGLPLVRIPAGTFTMGGSPAVYKNELPLRQVTLSRSYLLSAWPVTRTLWRRFDPGQWSRSDVDGLAGELPHTRVSWNVATRFCEWLSAQDGWTYRLPTEAEWERAARGGLEGMRYPWGNEPLDPTRANYDLPRQVPVGCYPPNAYGLFDMLGNCPEFTADRFHGAGYSFTPFEVTDPTGPTAIEQPRNIRAVRASLVGSPFSEEVSYVSWRAGNDANRAIGSFGFRVVAEDSR